MIFLGYCLLYIYIFLIGCCIGSFLNVAALRSAEGISFIKGRSHCPHCGETLRWKDLIPVFSYLFLRGRCRYCRTHIPARYLFTVGACELLFVLCFVWFGFSLKALNACLLAALLFAVFLIDMQSMVIPNTLVLFLIVPCVFDLCLTGFTGFWGRVIGIFAVSVPLLLLSLVIPGCFGGGDIKLMAVCGFLLGWGPVLLAFFLAVVSCGGVSMVRMAAKRVKKGDHVAFGPYLAAGIFVSYLFYTPLIEGYLSLMGL